MWQVSKTARHGAIDDGPRNSHKLFFRDFPRVVLLCEGLSMAAAVEHVGFDAAAQGDQQAAQRQPGGLDQRAEVIGHDDECAYLSESGHFKFRQRSDNSPTSTVIGGEWGVEVVNLQG